jgi:hypothetical protein
VKSFLSNCQRTTLVDAFERCVEFLSPASVHLSMQTESDIGYNPHAPPVTDEDLRLLTTLHDVESLDLVGAKITDRGMGNLARLGNLNHLGLINLAITNEGLRTVGQSHDLTWLNLYGLAISDAGLRHLHSLRNLECLHIQRTEVTAQGLSDLHRALPKCEIHAYDSLWPTGTGKP